MSEPITDAFAADILGSGDVAAALAVVTPGLPAYHITEQHTHLAMLALTMPPADIAESLGMPQPMVKKLLRRPEVRSEMARLNAEIGDDVSSFRGQVRALLSDALVAVAAVLTDPRSLPADIVRAAAFLADRAGLPKVSKSEIDVRKTTMSGQEILEAQQRALAAQREGRALATVTPLDGVDTEVLNP